VNATDQQAGVKPTIVLVHGAFADASSWNGVIERLQQQGYTVVAPANPLRGVAVIAALWPDRCTALVSVNGYLIGSQAANEAPLPPQAELA
jgi:hypothetical protein